jgi:hypothetical protein
MAINSDIWGASCAHSGEDDLVFDCVNDSGSRGFSVEVTRSAIEPMLGGADSAEVDAVDLYEVMLADLKIKLDASIYVGEAHKGRVEVLAAELAKFKSKVRDQKAGSVSALETLKTAKRIRDEITDELSDVRNDRRYLTMLVDSIIHDDFFTCDEGSASLFSFSTYNVSSTEDGFAIDENFPIALWLNKNGFACILGVSADVDENGERSLVMPDSPSLSRKRIAYLCPPKKYHNEIAEKLMQYDVKACNEALARSRLILSTLAIKGEYEENGKLTNKELIAVSRTRRESVAAHFASKSKRKVKAKKGGR